MSQSDFPVTPGVPTLEEYLGLRAAAGLTAFSAEAAEKGLAGTVHSVTVRAEGDIIGMGRIIGDGGCFFQIVDIAVSPRFQGHGIGKKIMSALMDHVTEALPASAYISLIADVPANKLYEKYGFRETAPAALGMAYKVG